MRNEILKDLKSAIILKDSNLAISYLEKIETMLQDDEDLILEITTPAIINDLFDQLIVHMEVPKKLLMLKNRVVNRKSRAILFSKLMKNGIQRVCKTGSI